MTIPFDSLTRSAEQPAGAPNDGLSLNDVWGYSFDLPGGGTSSGVLAWIRCAWWLNRMAPKISLMILGLVCRQPGSIMETMTLERVLPHPQSWYLTGPEAILKLRFCRLTISAQAGVRNRPRSGACPGLECFQWSVLLVLRDQ